MAETVELSDEVKTFIVQSLACWDTPSVVAAAVKAEFDVEITRQRVETYDPTKRAGAKLSQGFREIFEATRKKFLEDTAEIGISHKSVRLRMLDRGARHFESVKNFIGAADLCERAAKEMGGAFTNQQKHELTGKDGQPLPPQTATIVLTGRPESSPPPQAVDGVRKPGD